MTSGVIFAVLFTLLTWAMTGNLSPVSGALGGVVFGVAMGCIFASTVRQNGGEAATRALRRAFRSRTLPTGADPHLWSTLLDRHDASANKAKYFAIFFAALAVLYVVLALNATGPTAVAMWASVVLFAGLVVWTPLEARARRSRVRVLREQLAQVSGGRAGTGGHSENPSDAHR